MLGGISALVILIIVFVAAFISTNISKPIRTTQAAQEFGREFSKITICNDELGLFKTFNTMAANIQASQAALEELAKTKLIVNQIPDCRPPVAHPMAGIRWVTNAV